MAVLLAALLVLGGSGCSQRSEKTAPAPSTAEELLAQLRDQRAQIDQTTDRMMDRIAEFNRSRRPDQHEITISDVFFEDLSDEQKDVLNQLIAEEKNPSFKTLLGQIVDDREKLKDLQDQVQHLEQTLPDTFVVAKKNDSHHALAMDYLTGTEGLDNQQAEKLLARIDQTDVLLPGNKVWFAYDRDHDVFRTYVTAGDAGKTPLAVRRAMKRRLLEERDAAAARAEGLDRDNAELAAQIATLQSDVGSLERQRAGLQANVNELQANRDELQSRVKELDDDLGQLENSVFFHTATQRDLRQQDVVTRVRKQLRDVSGVEFDDQLDLRRSQTITLRASELGLETIKGVRLLPSIYVEGRDYTIERSEDGETATLTFKDGDLFRGKEILLSVRGPAMAERT